MTTSLLSLRTALLVLSTAAATFGSVVQGQTQAPAQWPTRTFRLITP